MSQPEVKSPDVRLPAGTVQAVRADDALLDRVGAGHGDPDSADELERTLAQWQRQVTARASTLETVTVDVARVAIEAGKAWGDGHRPLWWVCVLALLVFLFWFALTVAVALTVGML